MWKLVRVGPRYRYNFVATFKITKHCNKSQWSRLHRTFSRYFLHSSVFQKWPRPAAGNLACSTQRRNEETNHYSLWKIYLQNNTTKSSSEMLLISINQSISNTFKRNVRCYKLLKTRKVSSGENRTIEKQKFLNGIAFTCTFTKRNPCQFHDTIYRTETGLTE